MTEKQETIQEETETIENSQRKPKKAMNSVFDAILALSFLICATYFVCLFVVTGAIVVVVLAIIYGVCHTVLEFFSLFKRKKNEENKKEETKENSENAVLLD